MFLNNCSVGDLSSLWPTESEENQEVTIREIADESFDPEDIEEIEMPNIDNEISNDISILEENEDDTAMILEEDADVSESPSEEFGSNVEPIQTYVGDRVSEMRDEFASLDQEIKDNNSSFNLLKASGIASAEVYHSTVAAIAARLQIGTTPGNPILLNQYERALTELAEVGDQGQQLVELGKPNIFAICQSFIS